MTEDDGRKVSNALKESFPPVNTELRGICGCRFWPNSIIARRSFLGTTGHWQA